MKKATTTSVHERTFTIAGIFRRYHLTLFLIFVIGCVSGSVYVLNAMLTEAAAENDYTSNITAGTIDQATLDRLQSLHGSSEPYEKPPLPTGRVNPFGE